MLASFKLDIATVMQQPGEHQHTSWIPQPIHVCMLFSECQFYHKWAVLTDPDDTAGSCKGYIKCDISIITKVSMYEVLIHLFNMFQTNQGDAVKIPNKTDNDDDDIES